MVTNAALNAWFCREVLPREPVLTRFISRHWRSSDELLDIRQDVYERVLLGANRTLPDLAGPYIFTVARNVMINRARRAKIIKIDLVAELEQVVPDIDWLTPARHVEAREELRRVQAGLDVLPPRCREVLRLRKVEGLSTQEVSQQLGIGIDAVEKQMTLGMRALIDFMHGGDGRVQRPSRARTIKHGPVS
ncbi:sigma-70 family RNA polymerase sigma factor [Sphingobium sp. AN641]|uniref:RNA polymerase sigma factor n=1 Tax=Sphingobium sp. AN641 TaxID=3133443 RepID=UPI0030C63DFD